MVLHTTDTAEANLTENVSLSPYAEAPMQGALNSAPSALGSSTAIPSVTPQDTPTDPKAYFETTWFRAVEILTALTLIVLFSPLMLVVAFSLKLQGLGSVIYKQTRIGLGGKNFTIYKFRSMFENAEKSGPFICTTYTDSRITPLGALLRKSKIDELPQLWNVVLGNMSFIGPRPERPCFHQEFLSIENWARRVQVKPGITGLAQISAVISHDPKQKIIADIAYLNNRTFWSDIKLMLITAVSFLRPKYMFGIPIK